MCNCPNKISRMCLASLALRREKSIWPGILFPGLRTWGWGKGHAHCVRCTLRPSSWQALDSHFLNSSKVDAGARFTSCDTQGQ